MHKYVPVKCFLSIIDDLFGPSSKVEEEDDRLFGQDDGLFAKKSGGLFSGGDSLFDDQEEEVFVLQRSCSFYYIQTCINDHLYKTITCPL